MIRTRNIWSEHHGESNFIKEYPDCSMFTYLNNTAKKYPDYTALEFQNKKTSFSEMINQIEIIARSLLANGIKKGDYVSIVSPNTPQALNMVYAINRIGAIANMIHPMLSPIETKKLVENVNSVAVLTFDILVDKFSNISWKKGYNPLLIVARIVDSLPVYIKPLYS